MFRKTIVDMKVLLEFYSGNLSGIFHNWEFCNPPPSWPPIHLRLLGWSVCPKMFWFNWDFWGMVRLYIRKVCAKNYQNRSSSKGRTNSIKIWPLRLVAHCAKLLILFNNLSDIWPWFMIFVSLPLIR